MKAHVLQIYTDGALPEVRPICQCGQPQIMKNTVDAYPLTEFEGGLQSATNFEDSTINRMAENSG